MSDSRKMATELDGAALDVWALGVQLYMMAFARVPWNDAKEGVCRNYTRWVKHDCNFLVLSRHEIAAHPSKALLDLLGGMLALDPLKRLNLQQVSYEFFLKSAIPATPPTNQPPTPLTHTRVRTHTHARTHAQQHRVPNAHHAVSRSAHE